MPMKRPVGAVSLLADPEILSIFDTNRAVMRETRQTRIENHAYLDAPVFASHFTVPRRPRLRERPGGATLCPARRELDSKEVRDDPGRSRRPGPRRTWSGDRRHLRGDGTIQSSLVNAGIVPHPATGESTLAFVTIGPVKLANLRARPQVTATFRNGWQWAAVEGHAELAGPDDPHPGSTPNDSAYCSERSSPLPTASTTTGTPTTEPWPRNAEPPCSSAPPGLHQR